MGINIKIFNMKFVAVALIGTAAAKTAAAPPACITGVTVYSDDKCKTAIDTAKDAKAKAVVDKEVKAAKAWCTVAGVKDKTKKTLDLAAMKAKVAEGPGKCSKTGAADTVKSLMFMNTTKGASYLAAGAAAVLAFAATQF